MKLNEAEEINGSEIITPKGKAYFYEVEATDIEHKYTNEKQELYYGVVNSLNTLKHKGINGLSKTNESNENNYFYKIYTKDAKTYIATDDPEFSIEGYVLRENESPQLALLGVEDIYSDTLFEKDHFVINGKYWRFVNLYTMPSHIDFNEAHIYGDTFMCFRKYPTSQAKHIAGKSRRSHSANINGSINGSLESEKTLVETTVIYNSLLDGTENLFDIEFWYTIQANSKDELDIETSRVISFIKRKDGDPLIETVANSTILKMYVPGDFVDFRRAHQTITSFLACLIPYTTETIHSSGSVFYSTSFNAVNIGLFDKTALNFNALFTGKSGSGKSVLGQKFVLDLLKDSCSAVILDKGKSFDKISRYMNGNIFSEKFNPMQFKDAAYLKAFIMSVIPESEMSAKDRGKMYELIKEALKDNRIQSFKQLIGCLKPSFKDIDCYFSEYWEFISDKDIEIKDLTYVDTSIYPKNIVGSVIIYLIEYFKHVKGRKIFVFDECWEYLTSNAEYIEECFRTFRKHDGSAIAITQDIQDFLMSNSKVGQVVFNNTNHKFFFMQDTISEGHINNEDAELIKSLRTKQGMYSEFLYKDDYCRKIVRYPMSQLEHELFTTKKEHNLAFEKFSKRFEDYFTFSEIMHKWIDFKYNHKVPQELS